MYISELLEEIGYGDVASDLWDYICSMNKDEITLGEIFEETNLNEVSDFRATEEELVLKIEGFDVEVAYSIELIVYLALLALESKKSGIVNFEELNDEDKNIKILAGQDEVKTLVSVLEDFSDNAMEYDLSEMMDEDEMAEMAEGCKKLLDEIKVAL